MMGRPYKQMISSWSVCRRACLYSLSMTWQQIDHICFENLRNEFSCTAACEKMPTSRAKGNVPAPCQPCKHASNLWRLRMGSAGSVFVRKLRSVADFDGGSLLDESLWKSWVDAVDDA